MANLKSYIYLSVFLHFAFVISFILFEFVTKKKFEDLSYVEVSFGLNENLVQTRQFDDKKLPEGERLALKDKNKLPQLTKNSAPIVSQPQQKIQSSPDDLHSPVKKPLDSVVKPRNDKNTKLENEKSGNLEMKDFLKRKEETLRKTGDKAQTGQKEIDKTKKIGRKVSTEDIPRSPFDTLKIPKAASSAAPTGIESGTNTESFDIYKTYLRNQLKLNWNIPDISAFPPTLITIISITVNEFGYLVGNPKIVESSRNNEFDKLVVEAVVSTFPVSNPPPKDIRAPHTFNVKYNSRDIK